VARFAMSRTAAVTIFLTLCDIIVIKN